MKLRSKKTGETAEFMIHKYVSLTDGNPTYAPFKGNIEEWEDVPEEPKEYWYLTGKGNVCCIEDIDNDFDRAHKEIGNYFESEEEAAKVVEKLKAWKRLKDKCFRFYRWNKGSVLKSLPNTIEFACDDYTHQWSWEDIQDDLDLLFGGEE